MVVIREAEIIISPVDNVTPSLDAISRFLDRLSGSEIAINLNQGVFDAVDNLQSSLATLDSTPVTVAVDVQGDTSAFKNIDTSAQKSTGFVDKLSSAGDRIGSALQGAGSVGMGALGSIEGLAKGGVSAFSAMGDAINRVSQNVGNMVTSMAGMAAGGAVAGLSWLDAAKDKLYEEEIYKSIDANKKLGVSRDMLKEKAKSMNAEAPGWTTNDKATEDLYNTMATSSKYVGKGETGLDNSEAISKFFFANQERLQKGGIGDTSQLILNAIRTPGKMGERFAGTFQKATGLTDAEMLSAKTRMKAFMDQGEAVKIKTEIDARPWIAVQNNVSKLQRSIGDSLAGPLSTVSGVVSGIAEALATIPGAAGLIGWLAIAIATTSAFSLLGSVLSPFITLLGLVKTAMFGSAVATNANTVATMANTGASNLSIVARLRLAAANIYHAMATGLSNAATAISSVVSWGALAATTALAGMYGVLAGSETLATIATWGLNAALAVFDALDPFTYLVIGAVALAAVLGVVAYKFGFLSNIKLPDLSKIFKGADLGKMVFSASMGGPISLITGIFTKLTGGVDLLGVMSGMIYDVLKKLKDIWSGFVDWLKGGWKAITDIADALVSFFGGKTEADKTVIPGDTTRQIKPGEAGAGWADRVKDLVEMNPDLANNPAKALEEVRKMYPATGKAYSDDELKDLVNNIEEYANAPDTARPGLYKSLQKVNVTPDNPIPGQTPQLPPTPTTTNPFDARPNVQGPVEQAAAGLGLPVIAGQTNKAGLLSSDIGTAGPIERFASSLGLPSIAALFGGGSTEAAPTETPAPTSTPAPYAKGSDTSSPTTMYVNSKTGVTRTKEEIGGYSPEDQAKFVQVPGSASGSEVLKSGLAVVHEGNQIAAAKLGRPGKLNEALGRLQSAPEKRAVTVQAHVTVELNQPVVNSVAEAFHLSDIIKRELDGVVEQIVMRKIGQYIT